MPVSWPNFGLTCPRALVTRPSETVSSGFLVLSRNIQTAFMLSLVVALCGFSLVCSGVHSGYEKCVHDGLPFLLTVEVFGKKEQEALLESEDGCAVLVFSGLQKCWWNMGRCMLWLISAVSSFPERVKNFFEEFFRGPVSGRGLLQFGVAAFRL